MTIISAPTETSKSNLLKENISEDSILVTGNTVIDALIKSVDKVNENPSQLIQGPFKTNRESRSSFSHRTP